MSFYKKYLPVGMKEAVTHCLDSFVPFYLYRLPEREGGRLGFGVSLSGRIERKTADFSVPGFVAAPFDSEEEVYFIPGEFECGGDLTDRAVRNLKDAVFSGIRMPCPESGDMDKEAYQTGREIGEILPYLVGIQLSYLRIDKFPVFLHAE